MIRDFDQVRRPRRAAARFVGACAGAWLCALVALPTCSDAGLQPLPDESITYLDDKLALSGQFCTSPSDEVSFPVKLLIVIDQSASLQCTDPGNNRLVALNQAGSELDPLPNVLFGVIGFSSWVRIVPFTPDWSLARDALAPDAGQGGPATDYQGALSTVVRVLEEDILASGAAQTARTKYVILFVSDGVPEPRCRAGCDDGDSPPDSLYGVCNTEQEIPDGVYVDMDTRCPEYNQEAQVVQKVQDIVALGDFYGVGDLTFNTLLLFAPPDQLMCPAEQFGYIREEAAPLLAAMADEGNGTFRDVNISTEIDFLEFNYESLRAPYELIDFMAVNMNAVPTPATVLSDSDGDGLDDAREFEAGLDRLARDSDGDWFLDQFELLFATRGFDALDGAVPAVGCTATLDRDADGLRECEEHFLGSDPLLPDTDGDRLLDGLEVRFGLDPLVPDTLVDHDFDGRLSGYEIHTGTNPQALDDDDLLGRQVLYNVVPGIPGAQDVRCYEFTVQGLTLVPTLTQPNTPRLKGTNRVLVYAQEIPAALGETRGRTFVACVEARYLGPTFKDPPSGTIGPLSPERFVELQLFDPALHCLAPAGDPTQPAEGVGP